MKIGILTWGRSLNYGGILQALATVHVVRELGYEAELIDYVPNEIGIYSYVRLFHDFPSLPLQKRMVLDSAYFFIDAFINGCLMGAVKRIYKFNGFFDNVVPFSKRQYRGFDSLAGLESYDLVLVGSDQLWNPAHFVGKCDYLLDWLPDSVARISYATSVASDNLGGQEDLFRRALKKFSAISVREKSSVALLQPFVEGKDVQCVVDPTQLLSAETWSSVLKVRADARTYDLVVYKLTLKDNDMRRICQDARGGKKSVLILTDLRGFGCEGLSVRSVINHCRVRLQLLFTKNVCIRKGYDPAEFVEAIKNAKAIVTDSFHAVMFSTIFDRPVKFEIPEERRGMSSRVIDFLSELGVHEVDGYLCLNADSKLRLRQLRENSRAWLDGALKKL